MRNFEKSEILKKNKTFRRSFFGKCALVFNIAFVLIIVLGGRGELWEFYVVVFALTPFINAESLRNSEAQKFGIIETLKF